MEFKEFVQNKVEKAFNALEELRDMIDDCTLEEYTNLHDYELEKMWDLTNQLQDLIGTIEVKQEKGAEAPSSFAPPHGEYQNIKIGQKNSKKQWIFSFKVHIIII